MVSGTKSGDTHFVCRSHSAASRMSASLILLFELEYMKRLQCCGWNSAAVITSVNSSIFTGLISTISMDYQSFILIMVVVENTY